MYDILDYHRLGWRPEEIALHLRATLNQVEKALEHIAPNRAEVEHEYQQMVERSQRGNSPELEAKLQESRLNLLARKKSLYASLTPTSTS